MPDGAQPNGATPPEGQGTEGQDGGLYGDFLDGIPPEHHDALTERLKAKDADFTKRFQANSERWKPYEDLGIHEADPEALGQWLSTAGVLAAATEGDEEAVESAREWWQDLGKQLGFNEKSDEPGDGSDLLDLSPDDLKETIGDEIAKRVDPLLERFNEQEQEQLQANAEQEITESLSALHEANQGLTEEDDKVVLALGAQFAPQAQSAQEIIDAGFEVFRKIKAGGENELFASKANQPAPAEGAGRPNTTPPDVTGQNVRELARERFRQAAGT